MCNVRSSPSGRRPQARGRDPSAPPWGRAPRSPKRPHRAASVCGPGPQAYGALQIGLRHVRKVEQPDHYLLVGDAEGDGFAVERMGIPELPDLGGQEVVVGDLSIENRPWRKPVIADMLQGVPAAGTGDLDGLDGPAVYVEADGSCPPESR